MQRKQSWLSRYPVLHIAFNALLIGLFVWGLALGVARGFGSDNAACVAQNVPGVGRAVATYCR